MAQKTGGNVTQFLYDANGLFGMVYLGGTYYYQYNGQGDVIGLVDYQGNQVVTYTYDAWGNPVSIGGTQASSAGAANPFRYRGYYYDAESGLYYLQSRYYDPVVGRFINADGIIANMGVLLTPNLFAYCVNNPVNKIDPYGLASDVGRAIPWDEAVKELLTALGGAIAGISAGASALGGLILSMPLWLSGDSAQTFSNTETQVQAKALPKVDTRSLELAKRYTRMYFGAAIDKQTNTWYILTGPMNSNEAMIWASVSALSGQFNTNDSWGLYTFSQTAAYAQAMAMSGWQIPYGPESSGAGTFMHYHTASRKFGGRFKHFHFWYGLPTVR